jgi:pimeloyl-ACP methyl ester carboxylesterase
MERKSIHFMNGTAAYFCKGSGDPLVLIHGFPMDHAVWENLAEALHGQYRVILPDLPGFGDSGLPAENLSIERCADLVDAILTAEKISTCILIGHSMGGYITLNFAQRFPQRLQGLGLFHSTAMEDDERKKLDRVRAAEFVRLNGSPPFVSELFKKLFAENFKISRSEVVEQWKNRYAGTGAETIAQASLAMGHRSNTLHVLREAKVPVLFILGKEDQVIPLEKVLPQVHLPGRSKICLLEKSGHMGLLEEPENSIQAIKEFLEWCKIAPAHSA